MSTTVRSGPFGLRRAIAIGAVMAVAALVVGLGAAPAHAIGASGLRSTDFYAFTRVGESLSFSFAQSQGVEVRSPDGAVAASCASGPCSATIVSAVEGVWFIKFTAATDNTLAWTVQVRDAANVVIQGRAWSEAITFSNTAFTARNFTATYLSEFGGMYRAQFTGHNGWVFQLRASNRGVMFNDGSCLPAYRSVPGPGDVEPASGSLPSMIGNDYLVDSQACRDLGLVYYRIFLGETPDPSMPESTPLWGDGRSAQTWVLPEYQTPEIVDLHYVRDGFTAVGDAVGTLLGQSGTVRLRIDTDANGVFTDPVDVEIDIAAPIGEFTIPWDGIDGDGDPVPAGRDFRIQAQLLGESEIHFLEFDVEGRTGGVSVTRINGPDAPDSRVSWNDGFLPGARATPTTPLVGDRVDSTLGVHRWAFNGNGWGNSRYIDDWMTIYPNDAIAEAPVDGLPVLAVGDLVWYDADHNGLQESDEPGIPGVTVRVLAADDTVLGTAVTDADGLYSLEGLDAALARRVAFDVSTADVTGLTAVFGITTPTQLAFTTQHAQGSPSAIDSDVDPATGEAALPDVTAGADTELVDAGLIADAVLTVSKTVAGPAPAGFAYGFTADCTDFRGSGTTTPFSVLAGQDAQRSFPAGVVCVIEETSTGGAASVAYAVDGGSATPEPPTLDLLASTESLQVAVTNTFVSPPATGGSAGLGATGADPTSSLLLAGGLLAIGGLVIAFLMARRRVERV